MLSPSESLGTHGVSQYPSFKSGIPSLSSSKSSTSAIPSPSVSFSTTTIAIALSQTVLSAVKQIWYPILYVPEAVFAGTTIVPSAFILTPVSPPSFEMFILLSIKASVAGLPFASSVPFPLSAKTEAVVPPVIASIKFAEKSSSFAVIVNEGAQAEFSPLS